MFTCRSGSRGWEAVRIDKEEPITYNLKGLLYTDKD